MYGEDGEVDFTFLPAIHVTLAQVPLHLSRQPEDKQAWQRLYHGPVTCHVSGYTVLQVLAGTDPVLWPGIKQVYNKLQEKQPRFPAKAQEVQLYGWPRAVDVNL